MLSKIVEGKEDDLLWQDLIDEDEFRKQHRLQKSKSLIVSAVRIKKENKSANANKPSNANKISDLEKINENANSENSSSISKKNSADEDLMNILDDEEINKNKKSNYNTTSKKINLEQRQLNIPKNSPLLNLEKDDEENYFLDFSSKLDLDNRAMTLKKTQS